MRHIQRVCVICLLLTPTVSEAALIIADFTRVVSVSFTDEMGNLVTERSDNELAPTGGAFVEPLSAAIGGAGFSAQIGMQASGLFGVAGQQFIPGELSANVFIMVDVENTGTTPIDVPFGFLIFDGMFHMTAGAGSTVSYALDVGKFPFGDFNTSGTLEATPLFTTTFTSSGQNIGATHDGSSNVSIPFSFNTGTFTLAPGEQSQYFYELDIRTNVVQFAEGVFFEFTDPSQLGKVPPDANPFQVGSDPPSAVSEPSLLALWLVAGATLGRIRGRRPAR